MQPLCAGPLVRQSVCRGVATLAINRPEVSNSLNEATLKQLHRMFFQCANDSQVHRIVIGGTGKTFTVGADVAFLCEKLAENNLEAIFHCVESAQKLFHDIDHCQKPVIARVHGAALGGGLELALACDGIVASPQATLAFPETGLGIFPSGGGTQRTPRKIGLGLTKWLIFTGRFLSPQQAYEIGLVDQVVPREQLDTTVTAFSAQDLAVPSNNRPLFYMDLEKFFVSHCIHDLLTGTADPGDNGQLVRALRDIGRKAPLALHTAETLIEASINLTIKQGVQLELDHLLDIYRTQDASIGLASLHSKLPPVFRGY